LYAPGAGAEGRVHVVGGRVRSGGDLALVRAPVRQALAEEALGEVREEDGERRGLEEAIAARHLRDHEERGHGHAGGPAEHSRHAEDDEGGCRLAVSWATPPPSIAPTKSVGAKTPPEPPDDTVSAKARALARSRRSIRRPASRPPAGHKRHLEDNAAYQHRVFRGRLAPSVFDEAGRAVPTRTRTIGGHSYVRFDGRGRLRVKAAGRPSLS
jgi:hypothetical protein